MRRSSPVLLVLVGILSVQFGAGIADSLFDRAAPTTLVWLRLLTSTVVLLALVQPRLRGRSRADWLAVLGFGAALGLMNWSIYQSFARIPLGLAVTVEFAGPLALALAGSRHGRDLVWAALAAAGVLLLGLTRASLTWAGVGFALLAGAAWASYILMSRHTGRLWPGLDGLAVASTIATIGLTPYTLAARREDLGSGSIWLLGAAVGVLSSVIPYSCELVALRSVPPSVFGILMSVEPAAAAMAGLLIDHQHLGLTSCLAIACVVVASVGATRTGGLASPSPEPM